MGCDMGLHKRDLHVKLDCCDLKSCNKTYKMNPQLSHMCLKLIMSGPVLKIQT